MKKFVILNRGSSLSLTRQIRALVLRRKIAIAILDELFNNLLENMARYTQSPGELTLDCRSEGDQIIIEFHNSGPGVSLEQVEQLFDEKQRQDPRPDHVGGGAGLGLAICRKIVEAHDGVIAAEPSPLGGMLIRVQLPARRAEAGAP